MRSQLLSFLIFVFFSTFLIAEENFLLIDDSTGEIMCERGPHLHERVTPCSTFKIALSLMGFDAGILKDQHSPTWPYQEGYDSYLDSWKAPQTPFSWMKHSCVWYSRLLATELGLETMQSYLHAWNYGNQDLSGGLTKAWLSSSLKISPQEQVSFIRKILHQDLQIADRAFEMTRALLFLEVLPGDWKLSGKTGLGTLTDEEGQILEIGWFVGWVEKEGNAFPFAYQIRDKKINTGQRIPRVKQLLIENGIIVQVGQCR